MIIITKKEEKQFEKELYQKLKNQYKEGMISGSKAICSVILDKVNNDKVTDEEKIKEIKLFCENRLGENKNK